MIYGRTMTLAPQMLPVLRIQHPHAGWIRTQELDLSRTANLALKVAKRIFNTVVYTSMNSARSHVKSGGFGVYTGGRMNPKRAFTLIQLLTVIDISSIFRNSIRKIRQYRACVLMNNLSKEFN
jgi:hypothetical protein